MKQELTELEREIDTSTVVVVDFSTSCESWIMQPHRTWHHELTRSADIHVALFPQQQDIQASLVPMEFLLGPTMLRPQIKSH